MWIAERIVTPSAPLARGVDGEWSERPELFNKYPTMAPKNSARAAKSGQEKGIGKTTQIIPAGLVLFVPYFCETPSLENN